MIGCFTGSGVGLSQKGILGLKRLVARISKVFPGWLRKLLKTDSAGLSRTAFKHKRDLIGQAERDGRGFELWEKPVDSVRPEIDFRDLKIKADSIYLHAGYSWMRVQGKIIN